MWNRESAVISVDKRGRRECSTSIYIQIQIQKLIYKIQIYAKTKTKIQIERWSTVSQQLLMGVVMWSSRDPISKQVPVASVFFTFCGQTHLAQMRYHFLAIYRDTASLTATLPIRTRDRIELADPYMYEGGNKWPNEQVSGVTWAGQSPLMMHPIYAEMLMALSHTYLSCGNLKCRISALCTHVCVTLCDICFD